MDDWQPVASGEDWQPVGAKTGEAKKPFTLADTWPMKLYEAIKSGGMFPGDVFMGRAAVPTSDNGGENIDRLVNLTNLAGMATMPVGGVTKTAAAPLPTAQELKNAGVDVFNAVKDVRVPPQQASNLSAKIENNLVKDLGFRDTPVSAQATLQEVRGLVPPNGAAPTIADFRSARMALGKYAGEVDQFGKPTPNAAAARTAMNHIDDYLGSLAPELNAANANYAAGSAIERVGQKAINAAHRAAKTGSGSNIENTMRQEVDKIPNRGLSDFEQLLKNQIVEGDATRNFLRKVGKAGFGDGLSILAHMGAVLPTAGASLPIGIAATGARKLGEQLTKNDIAELAATIARRSPLAQSTPPVMQQVPQGLLGGVTGGQLTLPQLLRLSGAPARADDDYR